jgi:putative transposase
MSLKFPRYGYRRIHVMLCRDGYACNRKRIQRLWRDEGLHRRTRKPRRRKHRRNPIQVHARRPDQVWAIDFVFDETAEGRPVKILNVTDEFHPGGPRLCTGLRLSADATVAILDHVVVERGAAPDFLHMDNDHEFLADALIDWCWFNRINASYIDVASGSVRRLPSRRTSKAIGEFRPQSIEIAITDGSPPGPNPPLIA